MELDTVINTTEEPPNQKVNPIIHNEELKNLRQEAQTELKKYSAKFLTDLEPSKNSHVSFKIELVDPGIKPIRCKMRPLAHNLKDKVRKALAEQEAAGIIRKVLANGVQHSEWSISKMAQYESLLTTHP